MSLNISSIYLYPEQNGVRHNTNQFEIVQFSPPVPVIRRGQSFNVAVRFTERDFDNKRDGLKVILSLGPKANTMKGTKGVIFVSTDENLQLDDSKWGGKIVRNEDRTLTLELMTPNSTPIGPWDLDIVLNNQEQASYEADLWILFNPWNKNDLVYMPESHLLDEYVLERTGKIWFGDGHNNRGRPWDYGQFDDSMLPAIMLMLDRALVPMESRGEPIQVCRAISRIVNYNDDNGVLIGRWDGDYSPHMAPSAWGGSVEIVEQFYRTKGPVMYGQCWVFAGVVTSVCRALGIPSRVVSNMVSAHDTNATLTVDTFYDENNEALEGGSEAGGSDSVWNYHVWNDVYMARPDLPLGYGGWQAIDSTPQEQSSGFFQCGPASLAAIREGAVGMNYDVQFMLSSVNADMVKWKVDPTSPLGFRRISSDNYHIGKMILTKKPFVYDPNGEEDCENIIDQYKAPEGTTDNRLSLLNAVRNTTRAKRFYDVPEETINDVSFTFMDLETVDIGKPFVVIVKVVNNSSEVRNIDAVLGAESVYYNGTRANSIKKSAGAVRVEPGKNKEIRMTVTPEDYIKGIVEYALVKMNAICTVQETKQIWSDDDDFQLITPGIKMQIKKDLGVNETTNCSLALTNPLNFAFTNCVFNISGSGIVKRAIKVPFRDIRGKESIKITVPVTGVTKGNFKIIATFTSAQLSNITGSVDVNVV